MLTASITQLEFCRNLNVGRPSHGLDRLSIKSHPNVEMDRPADTAVHQASAVFNNLDPQLAIGSAPAFSAPLHESRGPPAAEWGVIAREVEQLLVSRNIDPSLVGRIIAGMMELNPGPQT